MATTAARPVNSNSGQAVGRLSLPQFTAKWMSELGQKMLNTSTSRTKAFIKSVKGD